MTQKLNREFIWGVDLSLSETGFAVSKYETLKIVYITTILTKHITDDSERLLRLEHIARELIELQKKYPPKLIVAERAFVNNNFKNTAQALSEVHGLFKGLMGLMGNRNMIYYPPQTIKAAIYKGQCPKEAIQQKLLQELPDLSFSKKKNGKLNDNEADAVGAIVTYFIKERKIKWDKDLSLESIKKIINKK